MPWPGGRRNAGIRPRRKCEDGAQADMPGPTNERSPPMRRCYFEHMLTRNRVILAIYRLSGPEGLTCEATTAEIAAEAGRTVETVRRHLQELKAEGQVFDLGLWNMPRGVDGRRVLLRRRLLVLMDHPEP